MDRRAFLTLAASVAATSRLRTRPTSGLTAREKTQTTQTRTRLILLGTGGGPRPRKATSAPAQVIVAGGQAYVVDCGDGVAPALLRRTCSSDNGTSSAASTRLRPLRLA